MIQLIFALIFNPDIRLNSLWNRFFEICHILF